MNEEYFHFPVFRNERFVSAQIYCLTSSDISSDKYGLKSGLGISVKASK